MVEQKEILSEMRSFAGKGMNFSFYLKDYMLLSKTEILISFFFLKMCSDVDDPHTFVDLSVSTSNP